MLDLRLWAAAALLCASVGCVRITAKTPPVAPPPQQEPSEEARADFERVVTDYQRARRSGRLDGESCKRIAQAFVEVGQTHRALTETALFNAGAVFEECGQSDAALAAYERVLEHRPESAGAHNNLGVLLWRGGQRAEALRHFQAAVEVDPFGPEPRNNLATALRPRYVNNPDDATFVRAETALQTALSLRSDDPVAYENLARLYYDRGRLQDRSYLLLADLVISQGERVMKAKDEQSAELSNLRGLLFVEQDNPVQAVRAFRRATEANPDHVEAHLNRAMIAIRFRDFASAKKGLERALKDQRYSKNTEAYLGLGVARRGLRDYRGAAEAFERAHAVNRRDPRALYNLGILYSEHIAASKTDFDKASYEKAIDYFERFADRAGSKTFAKRVADARYRTKQIRGLIKIAEDMTQLEEKARREEAARLAEEKAERQRLLDLEKKALESAGG